MQHIVCRTMHPCRGSKKWFHYSGDYFTFANCTHPKLPLVDNNRSFLGFVQQRRLCVIPRRPQSFYLNRSFWNSKHNPHTRFHSLPFNHSSSNKRHFLSSLRRRNNPNDSSAAQPKDVTPSASSAAEYPSQEIERKKEGELFSKPQRRVDVRGNVKRVLELARPQTRLIGLAIGSLVVASSVSLLFPAGIGKIIDAVVNPDTSTYSLNELVIVLSAAFGMGGIATFVRTAALNTATERIIASLRKRLFGSIVHQEMAFFDTNKTGELINRLSSDIVVVSKNLTDNVATGIKRVAEGAGGICILFYLSPKLTVVMLGILPPVFLGGWYYGRFIKKLSRKVQDSLGQATQRAEETFSNIRTVKMFAQEGKEEERYATRIRDAYNLALREGLSKGVFYGSMALAGNAALLAVLYSGGNMVLQNSMTIGDLTSFMLYSLYVGFALSGSAAFYTDIMKGVGASSRIFELLDSKPAINPSGGIRLEQTKGLIEFKDVTFAYPTRPSDVVFNGFDMTITPGKTVAVVGESGSGKRFYDPLAGRVLLDGHDITELELSWLREQIGFVSQDVALFSGSIAENIAYGVTQRQVERQEIEEAARKANAHHFITDFPDGYDTQVGERGVTLSGGQKQRVAIARALLKDPPILVLDEATSSLDAVSERMVQLALTNLMKGRTSIVIAHRLSTIKDAHEIAVISDGRIVEKGTHAQLIARPEGFYRRLVLHQQLLSE